MRYAIIPQPYEKCGLAASSTDDRCSRRIEPAVGGELHLVDEVVVLQVRAPRVDQQTERCCRAKSSGSSVYGIG